MTNHGAYSCPAWKLELEDHFFSLKTHKSYPVNVAGYFICLGVGLGHGMGTLTVAKSSQSWEAAFVLIMFPMGFRVQRRHRESVISPSIGQRHDQHRHFETRRSSGILSIKCQTIAVQQIIIIVAAGTQQPLKVCSGSAISQGWRRSVGAIRVCRREYVGYAKKTSRP
ncbi:hypothetical protein BDZ94DRAFT_1266164 [Collybia nuda]|uniref:Uncharacterized protein n=1 Tax=Collybia nuda TaxID=64659 RepID=A0A9P5Y1A3_9AGAR|nr:hypothetical protein BDZ94DRAFT_1266164 [Collybia nuda]